MGQEWAASAPFLYFTDHEPGLGRLVTEGRRREFGRFAGFGDAAVRATIPDPQDEETFRRSRLDWSERIREPHAAVLALHRFLLALRRSDAAMRERSRASFGIEALNAQTLVIRRQAASGETLLAAVRVHGAGLDDLGDAALAALPAGRRWAVLMTTEDAAFVSDPRPMDVEVDRPAVRFERPGATIFRAVDAAGEGGA
jgi:maltooligosyltrehalose trehalohydrolase